MRQKKLLHILIGVTAIYTIYSLSYSVINYTAIINHTLLIVSASFASSLLVLFSSSLLFHKKDLKTFTYFGTLLFLLGIIAPSAYLIDSIAYVDKLTVLTIAIINFSVAHTSIVLSVTPKFKIVRVITITTIAGISLATFFLIHILNGNLHPPILYYKILGVFILLNTIGSILIPVFNSRRIK